MSYFRRIAESTIGTSKRKIMQAVTANQIPESFEIKNMKAVKAERGSDADTLFESTKNPKEKPNPETTNNAESLDKSEEQSKKNAGIDKTVRRFESAIVESEEKSSTKTSDDFGKSKFKENKVSEIDSHTNKEQVRNREIAYDVEPSSSTAESFKIPSDKESLKSENKKNKTPEPLEIRLHDDKKTQASKNLTSNELLYSADAPMQGKKIPVDVPIEEKKYNAEKSSVPDIDSMKTREKKYSEVQQVPQVVNPNKISVILPRDPVKIQKNQKSPPTQETVVTINIGRIEVTTSAQSGQTPRPQTKFTPPMSLNEYLKKREANKQ